MVERESVCLRRLAEGQRCGIVRYGRFLSNPKVTVGRLVEGWSTLTAPACTGRHVLAIQDTSEFNFSTTAGNRRGLGKIGKGVGHGLLLHAMLAVDAGDGSCLGLVAGDVWTRSGKQTVPHVMRPLSDKESGRWLRTAETAKTVLAGAAQVTVIADRESDIYAQWARVPGPGFHLLTRAMRDRKTGKTDTLSTARLAPAGKAVIDLPAQPGRSARKATLYARYGKVALQRPVKTPEKDLPETVTVHLVEVAEKTPPKGAKPILWRLLTTHAVEDAQMAWRIVGWYRRRWMIEQFFRTLKQQGLKVEDSQVATADALLKLTAIAARAACTIMQLVQARDGTADQSAAIAFTPSELCTLDTLSSTVEGRTAAQKNPHEPRTLAWAAWIIAKLGGWDGYKSSRPPGPITMRHGLQHFHAIAKGWKLRNV